VPVAENQAGVPTRQYVCQSLIMSGGRHSGSPTSVARRFLRVVTEALTRWMRGRLDDAWLAEHQARHGQFDENELRELAVDAGVPYVGPGRGRRFGRVNLVLDAGALIGIHRDDRRTAGLIELGDCGTGCGPGLARLGPSGAPGSPAGHDRRT
jgi:hypothetical protein